jgi:hypothetical protein
MLLLHRWHYAVTSAWTPFYMTLAFYLLNNLQQLPKGVNGIPVTNNEHCQTLDPDGRLVVTSGM